MVKITEKIQEDRKREERTSRLMEIAKKVLPREKIYKLPGARISFGVYKKEVGISGIIIFDDNTIYVERESMLNTAVRLAKEYEALGEPEFTVEKRY